ncbi:MAG: response regulator [Candidatus Eremiobacteraeota bacterium]|nr:response regulator [Candidatus Eremiobacteraeota bacterium]
MYGARSRTHEGSGIGLALARELVALEGGSITVESSPGAGTSFDVRIPISNTTAAAGVTADTRDIRRQVLEEARAFPRSDDVPEHGAQSEAPRVIVADDNADLRTYLARLLTTRYNVELARNGRELLDLAIEFPPDLIIADIMMPEMDGFATLSALRARPETAVTLVILLSARAGAEAAVEGLSRGADDYIVKPFVAADLMARVDALLRRSTSSDAAVLVRERRDAMLLSAAADRFITAGELSDVWQTSDDHVRPRSCRESSDTNRIVKLRATELRP